MQLRIIDMLTLLIGMTLFSPTTALTGQDVVSFEKLVPTFFNARSLPLEEFSGKKWSRVVRLEFNRPLKPIEQKRLQPLDGVFVFGTDRWYSFHNKNDSFKAKVAYLFPRELIEQEFDLKSNAELNQLSYGQTTGLKGFTTSCRIFQHSSSPYMICRNEQLWMHKENYSVYLPQNS